MFTLLAIICGLLVVVPFMTRSGKEVCLGLAMIAGAFLALLTLVPPRR
jgi:hypothetical protein